MRNEEIIRLLFETGHFNNPANPTGILEDELPLLDIQDEPVQIAIQSYRQFFAVELDMFSAQLYGKLDVESGSSNIGPATMALFAMGRCGEPDFATTGSGSWPKGCVIQYPSDHAIIVRVSKARMPSFLSSIFESVWDRVAQSYADMGMILTRNDEATKPHIQFSFENLRGSTIGLAIVPNNPRCSSSIWCKYDPGYKPSDLFNQWCRLLAHELGHNMGMSHSRGGIMNPSITQGPFTATAWRGDPSESLMRRYFGGNPVGPPPVEPDPPTDPVPGQFWFKGGFELMQGNTSLGEYILTPKPKV